MFKDFFRLDSKKYDMISVNVEIRKKLRKEMEKSYESKRSEFEKEKDKNSDGADGFRYTVGSQTVFPGELPQYVSGNSDPVFVHGTCVLDQTLGVTIPVGLETVILIFIFSAEILGEINAFYVKIPVWDTILHTTNGFLMAAIGFALIDLFNRSDRFSIKMFPYFVAFFAFCFSMTVGVLWEFFEFSMDWFFGLDMQKDWILPSINSVKLNTTGANVPVHVDIQSVVINGEKWNLGGYLDIGIVDTMKDLMVNFIGAVVFSIIGILYLKHRGKGKLAASLIPQVRDEKEQKR